METPEARRARLVAHAATMRATRKTKRDKPTLIDTLALQLERTNRLINRFAPDNIAPIPIAMALQGMVWTVDLHIRTEDAEYESDGTGRRLEDALATARTNLQANWPTRQFGAEGAQS